MIIVIVVVVVVTKTTIKADAKLLCGNGWMDRWMDRPMDGSGSFPDVENERHWLGSENENEKQP
jgi:hypothetical protein